MKTQYTTEQYTNAANYIEDKLTTEEQVARWSNVATQLRTVANKPQKIASRRVLSPVMRAFPNAAGWVRP